MQFNDVVNIVDENEITTTSRNNSNVRVLSVSEYVKLTDQAIRNFGYATVEGEISELKRYSHLYFKIKDELSKVNRNTSYGESSFERYVVAPAVWNFVEMVSFADFISFYAFYYDYMRMQCEYKKHFESVRRIRNACAHNVCMLASFKSVPGFKSDLETNFELLGGNIGIGNGTISSCMKVPLLNDFAVMLSVYTKLISSPKIKEITLQEIKVLASGDYNHYESGENRQN